MGSWRYRLARSAALGSALLLILVACGGGGADPGASAEPSGSPEVSVEPSMQPVDAGDAGEQLCLLVDELEATTLGLRAVELKLASRVALDIELSKVMAAFDDVEDADMGDLEDQLEASLTRLGYRLGELELAVEDFRTNSRIKRAVPHVEEDAETFASELAAFSILARC